MSNALFSKAKNLAASDPLIQVTDDQGNLTGLTTMGEAFERGLIRNTVYVVLRSIDGRFLMQRRSANVPNYPLHWDLAAGGHVDQDETPQAAAYRELNEELGITKVKLDFWGSIYFESDGDGRIYRYYAHIYTGVADDFENLNLDQREVVSTRLLRSREIKSFDKITPLAKHIVGKL